MMKSYTATVMLHRSKVWFQIEAASDKEANDFAAADIKHMIELVEPVFASVKPTHLTKPRIKVWQN
jgi:hypothetical protein